MNTSTVSAMKAAITPSAAETPVHREDDSKYASFANYIVYELKAASPSLFRAFAYKNKVDYRPTVATRKLNEQEVIQALETIGPQMEAKGICVKDAMWKELMSRRVVKPKITDAKTKYEALWKDLELPCEKQATQSARPEASDKGNALPGTKKTTGPITLDYYPPSPYQGVDNFDEEKIIQRRLADSPLRQNDEPHNPHQVFSYTSSGRADFRRILHSTGAIIANDSMTPPEKSEAIGKIPGLQRQPGPSLYVGDPSNPGVVTAVPCTPVSDQDIQKIRSDVKANIQSKTYQAWSNILTLIQLCSSTQLNCEVAVVVDEQVLVRTLLSQGSMISQEKVEQFASQSPSRVVLAMTRQTARQFASSQRREPTLHQMIDRKNITFLVTGKNDKQLRETMLQAIELHMALDDSDTLRLQDTLDRTFELGGTIQGHELPFRVEQLALKMRQKPDQS